MTARMLDAMADYLASDPEGLGMERDGTGLPALVGGALRKWPEATQDDVAEAAQIGAARARLRAKACFAEADALEAELRARQREGLTVIDGGKAE